MDTKYLSFWTQNCGLDQDQIRLEISYSDYKPIRFRTCKYNLAKVRVSRLIFQTKNMFGYNVCQWQDKDCVRQVTRAN